MKFQSQRSTEPEINLIAFIDVLLVILIFVLLSSTFSKYTEVQLNLPTADSQVLTDKPKEIWVSITSDGKFEVNKHSLTERSVASLTQSLRVAAKGLDNPMLVISADAQAPHQSVIHVMEAGKLSGLNAITFVARSTASTGAPSPAR